MYITRSISMSVLFVTCLGVGCQSLTSDTDTSDATRGYQDGSRAQRIIEFSGFSWWVKESDQRAGPGPNWWSASEENVWVDQQGRLHMKITHRDGKWLCAEVVCEEPAAYGTYAFYLNGSVDKLDPRVVLGCFTWDDTAYKTQANCEIDIEFSRWNNASAPNLHYAVQPVYGPDAPSGRYNERAHVSHMALEDSKSTHIFTWTPERVTFASFEGSRQPAHLLDGWTFNSDQQPRRVRQEGITSDPVGIPKPGPDTHVRINLWLIDANRDQKADPPLHGKEVEVIIERVVQIPLD